ncbi:hypothetical protein CCACVL1_04850 [Corchorus capsularis]|uniref:Uncharacterized protein n=1 Tax=Corchorus capsularis TaxID=210143 RepID=A0A1R3JP88_COCAP|nr:hypothetical protein CCACVL1_04850 [Corchorus capsularis]
MAEISGTKAGTKLVVYLYWTLGKMVRIARYETNNLDLQSMFSNPTRPLTRWGPQVTG